MARRSGNKWFVYLLRCADGTLYTGITKDVSRRCQQHNAGTASRYTRSRLPIALVYQESKASQSLALKREAAIKAMSRLEKESLIRQFPSRCGSESFGGLLTRPRIKGRWDHPR